MNLQEIKDALADGKSVAYDTNAFVRKNKSGEMIIANYYNSWQIGLTWEDGVTLNGKEELFHIVESNGMKTKLPEHIGTIEDAKGFLRALHENNESFHPDDDATDIIKGHSDHELLFTPSEAEAVNALMTEIHNLADFDPCEFLLDLDREPFVKLMADHGYTEEQTGGGCSAFRKEFDENGIKYYVLITANGDANSPNNEDEQIAVGLYDEDSETLQTAEYLVLMNSKDYLNNESEFLASMFGEVNAQNKLYGVKPPLSAEKFEHRFNAYTSSEGCPPIDAVEVHPVCNLNDYNNIDSEGTNCVICDEKDAQFYSVYVHLVEGGIECIADCSTEAAAQELAKVIEYVAKAWKATPEVQQEAKPTVPASSFYCYGLQQDVEVKQLYAQQYATVEEGEEESPLYEYFIEQGHDREGKVWELTICDQHANETVETYIYNTEAEALADGELLSELLDINEG